jgi:hypothetical protein
LRPSPFRPSFLPETTSKRPAHQLPKCDVMAETSQITLHLPCCRVCCKVLVRVESETKSAGGIEPLLRDCLTHPAPEWNTISHDISHDYQHVMDAMFAGGLRPEGAGPCPRSPQHRAAREGREESGTASTDPNPTANLAPEIKIAMASFMNDDHCMRKRPTKDRIRVCGRYSPFFPAFPSEQPAHSLLPACA